MPFFPFFYISYLFAQRLIAFLLVVVLSPLLFVVSVSVLLTMGWPIFFFQRRAGLNGRHFTIAKFRTMTNYLASDASPLSDEARLTPLGLWLRRSSLDELPQLVNIILGDMLFIGPRPLLIEYLPLYTPLQARRHLVRPGLTGLAQVAGRNLLSWNQKLKLDVWYVDNWSLGLDLSILCRTISIVILRVGVSSEGQATVSPFLGSSSDS